MPKKEFALNEQTTVTIYKRRASRNLRLSVTSEGKVRVSMPVWLPYSAGVQFARSRAAWITAQQPKIHTWEDQQLIGSEHTLRLLPAVGAQRISTRTQNRTIYIRYPSTLQPNNPAVLAAINRAATRALRDEAERLLPGRLAALAAEHGFSYRSVQVKQLKSRWGSCDQRQHIVLNLFLMQLPWNCIDYVLLHELSHTRVMDHSPAFWAQLEAVLPNAKQLRRVMREYQPILRARSS